MTRKITNIKKNEKKNTTLSEQFQNRINKINKNDRSLFWLKTGTSIKKNLVKPSLRAKT
jgi:hypothetical protein